MRILGIDPGITGAVAFLDNGICTHVQDLPMLAGEVDGMALWAGLRLAHEMTPIDMVFLEETHAMPKTGSMANYSQGFSKGAIVTALRIASLPITRVQPSVWKTKLGLRGKDKDFGRRLAMELFPDQVDRISRVKDHNRAEAMLIARYGSFTLSAEAVS